MAPLVTIPDIKTAASSGEEPQMLANFSEHV